MNTMNYDMLRIVKIERCEIASDLKKRKKVICETHYAYRTGNIDKCLFTVISFDGQWPFSTAEEAIAKYNEL